MKRYRLFLLTGLLLLGACSQSGSHLVLHAPNVTGKPR